MIDHTTDIDLTMGAGTFAAHLAHRTEGSVITPTSPDFPAAAATFNAATRHRPDAVLVAAGTGDVAAGVRTAADHGRCVAVQATGHGAAATAPGTVLVSTSRLDQVSIDAAAGTATVGPGATWQQVLDAAAPYGLTGLSGSAPAVGVVGYTVGGGLGPLARTFGFAADRVRSLDLVTADGRLRTVDTVTDPELFAAVLGGGGAFGVVVAMTFDLLPAPTLYGGSAFFPFDVARTVLHDWAAWSTDLPSTVNTSIARVNLPADPALPPVLRGAPVVHLRYAHVGDPADGARLVAPLLASAPSLAVTLGELPPTAVGTIHADPTTPMPVAEGGALLHSLPSTAIERFTDVTSPGSGLPLAVAEIRLMGGVLTRPPGRAFDALTGRQSAYHLHAIAVPAAGMDDATTISQVTDALQPWSTGQVLLNFAGAAGPARRAALRRSWDPETLARLTAVRDRVDPARIFAPMARW